MKKKRFLFAQNYRAPYMLRDGGAHSPHILGYKDFRKGEQVNGTFIRDAQSKPIMVMVDGFLPIPTNVFKEVVTKDVVISNAEGDTTASKVVAAVKKDAVRFKYADGAILGALLGFGIYKVAVKKTWITPENKNMLISIGVTAALTTYIVYRFTSKKKENG